MSIKILFNVKRSLQIGTLILALILLGLVGWMSTQKNSPFYQPIQSYELLTPIQQVTQAEIDKAVKPYLGSSFWDIPLNKVQAGLTQLDWVKSSQVKREWPNLLYISIEEQTPVARWGQSGLVNRSGEVFFPQSISGFKNLVKLNGTLDESEKVLRHFIRLQNQFKELNLTIKSLELSPDKIWHISFLNGPSVVLDSLNYEHKLQRFIKAYPKLDLDMRKSARIYDLRYSNGFIIAKK